MKKILGFLFSCIMLITVNANDTSTTRPVRETNPIQVDSLPKESKDEALENTMKQNEQNLDSFVREIRERERKEKQQMYLRLGLGIFFFIILIIGILRRKKRKAA